MNHNETGLGVGIPWYRREEYDALRASFADRDSLRDTFDDWLAEAEKMEGLLKRKNIPTVRVLIDSKSFLVWCKKLGLPLNSESRSRYAAKQAPTFFSTDAPL